MDIKITNLKKSFFIKKQEHVVFDCIDLDVKNGEFICLLGPSGCGKSTLLNIIAGLDRPTEGTVLCNDKPIHGPGPDRIMMFQESALFPWLTAIQNVEFGLKIAGIPQKDRRDLAQKYLKKVHLSPFSNSYLHQLSGGMRQRVALARALALDANVLLMDEPFAALDSQTKLILQMELQKIWIETQKTIVFVTHNVEEAVLLADKIVLMSVKPGGIKDIYTIKLKRPRLFDDLEITKTVHHIMNALKEEVEKVAKAEYDASWLLEEDLVLSDSNSDLGNDLQG